MNTNLSYPKHNCLNGRCLARLLNGETLTHRGADSATGSYRLAAPIHYLSDTHGWHIERRQVTDATEDPIGRAAKFTEYWLPDWLIRWAGTEGQQYVEKVFNLESKRIAERLAATSPTADDNPDGTDNLKTSMDSDSCNEQNDEPE